VTAANSLQDASIIPASSPQEFAATKIHAAGLQSHQHHEFQNRKPVVQ